MLVRTTDGVCTRFRLRRARGNMDWSDQSDGSDGSDRGTLAVRTTDGDVLRLRRGRRRRAMGKALDKVQAAGYNNSTL